jgi:hypothetical protein
LDVQIMRADTVPKGESESHSECRTETRADKGKFACHNDVA